MGQLLPENSTLARDKKRGGDGITIAVAERAGQGRLLTVPLAALMEDV